MPSVLLIIFLATSNPTGIAVQTFAGPSSCRIAAEVVAIGRAHDEAAAVACVDAANGDVLYLRTEQPY